MKLIIMKNKIRIVPTDATDDAYLAHTMGVKNHDKVEFEVKRDFSFNVEDRRELGESRLTTYLEWVRPCSEGEDDD